MPTPADYSPGDWSPEEWKDAWNRGAIGQNTGLPVFPPGSVRYNSRGDPYNPTRVGHGGVTPPANPFPRDGQIPTATPAAYQPPANGNVPQPPAQPETVTVPPEGEAKPVTPGQYSPTPWGHPQVATVPPVPRLQPPAVPPPALTLPPDKQGNRYWNPVAPQQPFADQINRYSHEYGIPANLLSNLLRAESNFNPRATGPMTKYGQAEGIAQFIPQTAARYHINPYDPDQGIRGAAEYLRDLYNQKGSWAGAVAAYNGAKSIDVSQYRGSPEGRALIANAVALDGGLVKAGPLVPPPQNYRPVSYTPRGGYPSMFPDRPPSQWGRDTPDMFSGIGAIPHQREIPGVLGALAPFLMIGLALFSKGAALPMLSAFGGYQNARNKRQEEDAKNLRTKYQDQLKELKAKMGIEQVAYAGAGGDQTELRRLATEFGDDPLLAILNNGGDPTALFQQRDKAFQDVSKTDLAERRFQLSQEEFIALEEQRNAQNERANARDDRERKAADDKAAAAKEKLDKLKEQEKELEKMGFPAGTLSGDSDSGSSSEGGGTTGSEGGSEGAGGGGSESGSTGEQGAATPPASEAPPAVASAQPPAATPAAAPETPTTAPPDTGRDELLDPQGNPIRPRADVRPAVYSGPPPTAQPVADTATEQQPKTPFDNMVSDVLNGKEYNQLGIPKDAYPRVAAAVNEKEAQIDALPAGPDYLDKLKAIDNTFGTFAEGLSNYTQPLPTTRGISGRDYMNRGMAAAQKINPRWSYQNFKRQEEFADQKGIVQTRLTRASTMGEAAANVAKDLKVLQDKGYTGDAISAAMAKGEANLKGYSDFTSLYSDLKSFVQEDQTLKTGTATVTETEAQQAIVAAPVVPGSPEQIRDFIAHNIDTAAAVIDAYQERWTKDADGKTRMPGRNDFADSVIAVMPYWNAKSGTFDNLPQGVTLPPQLVHSIPKQAGHLDPEDHDAIDWARAHPDDPRAGQILKKLGQ